MGAAVDKDFGTALRELRSFLGMSLNDMAKELGVDQSMVCRYEQGAVGLKHESLGRLTRLAAASKRFDLAAKFVAPIGLQLGISPERLVGEMRRVA